MPLTRSPQSHGTLTSNNLPWNNPLRVYCRGTSLTELLLGAAIAIAAVIFAVSRSKTLKDAFARWITEQLTRIGLNQEDPSPPAPEPEILPEPGPESEPEPEPEPLVELPPPDYGNIRPVLGEEIDPEEFGPEIHEFPEVREAATRFEDFNRRLFIASVVFKDVEAEWTKTTTDDFATVLKGFSLTRLTEEIRTRLRPRYPVILDTYGYWAAASRNLEMDPDYRDEIVDAYLAIPEEERPVVVSVSATNRDGTLIFMRYGFENFTLRFVTLHPHIRTGLAHALDTLRGPRENWLWFSVARLRQYAVRADAEKRLELEAAAYLESQTEQARRESEDRNRFVKLFKHRIDQQALTLLPADAAAATDAAKAGSSS